MMTSATSIATLELSVWASVSSNEFINELSRGEIERDLGGHSGFEYPFVFNHSDFDAEDLVAALIRALDVARSKLAFSVDLDHLSGKVPSRIGIDRDRDVLSEHDLTELSFGDIHL